MTITVALVVLFAALIMTLISAASSKVPLWIALLLVEIVLLVEYGARWK